MRIITVKRNDIIRYIVFAMILIFGISAIAFSKKPNRLRTEATLYFVDARMMRLIPVKTEVAPGGTDDMARRVLDKLIAGRDDNPKIRRLIPAKKHCMSVEVREGIAYVDIKKDMLENHPEGRELEMLTVYSVVNTLTALDGITNVRFTIDGQVRKDFMGYLDMRETFAADYMV